MTVQSDWKIPDPPKSQQDKAESFIQNADPSNFAKAIIGGEFSEIGEEELREMLASAFSHAARLSGDSSGGDGLTDDPKLSVNQRLSTMAMDLRINLTKLPLNEQIFLYYPYLKPDNNK